MALLRFLALRYLCPEGRRVSVLTGTAILAVTMAVAIQILVLSVMRGFRADLVQKFVGLQPHLRIQVETDYAATAEAELRRLGARVVPSVEGDGILQVNSIEGLAQGVKLRGVSVAQLTELHALEWSLLDHGNPSELFAAPQTPAQAAIGSELAAELGLAPGDHTTVELIAPFGRLAPTGDLVPERLRAQVAAIFRSGLYEFDRGVVMLDLASAQRVLGPQAQLGLWAYLPDPLQADAVAAQLRMAFPNLKITTWQQDNATLLGALKLERVVMSILLVLIVAIAATGIAGVLFLLVTAKQQEMGILLALGLPLSRIRTVFVLHGGIIGIIGSALGVAIALLGCSWIAHGGLPLPEALYLHTVPVQVSWSGLATIVSLACGLTMAAAYYPTRGLTPHTMIHWLRTE